MLNKKIELNITPTIKSALSILENTSYDFPKSSFDFSMQFKNVSSDINLAKSIKFLTKLRLNLLVFIHPIRGYYISDVGKAVIDTYSEIYEDVLYEYAVRKIIIENNRVELFCKLITKGRIKDKSLKTKYIGFDIDRNYNIIKK